jgi:acyl-CoA dehydrogenase
VDFSVSSDEQDLRDAVRKLCQKYPDEYWAEHDANHEMAWDFYRDFADAGYCGVCIPEEYGGGGAGVTEAAAIVEEVAASGGGLNACSMIHFSFFGLLPIVKHGNAEQRARFLPRAATGDLEVCFGVTEPDAGTDTTRITTTARKVDGGYLINGRKAFISRAADAERMLIIARTTPRDECAKPTDGMTLFFAPVDKERVEIRPISKLGRNVVATNWLYIDDLFVPDEDRIGEEGRGFRYLLDGLNPERILVAAECIGIGRVALRRATEYARERLVFGRPIGMNQGVQFPLAESLAKLDAAEMLMRKAGWKYDEGLDCAREANAAKLLCSTFAFEAADRAIQTHGGYGYTTEYHVERYWREVRLLRITPLANELIQAFLAEHVLGLPRSY